MLNIVIDIKMLSLYSKQHNKIIKNIFFFKYMELYRKAPCVINH